MSALSLATSVPVIPMATPISARLIEGRVVDAIAGHSNHFPVGAQSLDNAHFVFGRYAREDIGGGYLADQLHVIHLIQVWAGEHLVSGASLSR